MQRFAFLSIALASATLFSGCFLDRSTWDVHDANTPDGGPIPDCEEDRDCDDSIFCNGFEICAAGSCATGQAPACQDATPCTLDLCDELATQCVRLPDHAACADTELCSSEGCVPRDPCEDDADCDDGFVCNGIEACEDGECAPNDPLDCADAIACTVDLCSEASGGCARIPDDRLCEDDERCDDEQGCVDRALCAIDADCDDGNFCDGAEQCVDGRCAAGTPPPCADAVLCTTDVCNELSDACLNVPDHDACPIGQQCILPGGCATPASCMVHADCDDDFFCNGAERCLSGRCTTGIAPICEDAIGCTVDLCDEAGERCRNLPDDGACAVNESCDAVLGCVPECMADAECSDGQFCNGVERCIAGGCTGGGAPDCGDMVPCTTDLCDETADSCRNVPEDSACPVNHSCDSVVGCVPECIADSDCDDALHCNGSELCVSNGCVAGTAPTCTDGVTCTIDVCDEAGDRCVFAPDDALCGAMEVCESAGCVALGDSATHPGASCFAILTARPMSLDGVYWVDPDGAGSEDVRQVYCDMTSDGGGWTLVLKTDMSSAAHTTAAAVGVASLTSIALDAVAKHSDSFIAALHAGGEMRVEIPGVTPAFYASAFTWAMPDPGSYSSAIQVSIDLGAGYTDGVQCYDGDDACLADAWCLGIDIVTSHHVCVRRLSMPGIFLSGGTYTTGFYSGRIWVR